MKVIVATSYVTDGTMSDRLDPTNPVMIDNRRVWLATQGIAIEDAVRVRVTYDAPENNYCRYYEVDDVDKGSGMFDAHLEPADALVTTKPGVALFLPVADCVATTLYDEAKGVLMLVHLGRHSLEQQGGIKSLQYLHQNYDVDPATIKVWLSATVSKEAYPIFKLDNRGMKEALYEQLLGVGVLKENITDTTDDTATDPRYFSHSAFLKGDKPEDGTYAMVCMMVN